MKTKLIGSHHNLEQLRLRIENYFFSEIKLVQCFDENYWDVHNSKGRIEDCFVVFKGNRYRFERKA